MAAAGLAATPMPREPLPLPPVVAGSVIHGELVVAVPGIGRMAERRIVPGLLRRMDIEAQAMDDELSR